MRIESLSIQHKLYDDTSGLDDEVDVTIRMTLREFQMFLSKADNYYKKSKEASDGSFSLLKEVL